MATRHINVSFSLAPNKSQSQRFFALILQNVTDFSTYTADPIIGTYLTGGNTVSVTATGDVMPFTVVNNFNPGTANAITVLQIGDLYHVIANSTSANNCIFASSLQSGSYINPKDFNRASIAITTGMYSSATSLMTLSGSLKYTIRITDTMIAIASNVSALSTKDNWRSVLFAKHDNELIFVNRYDAWAFATAPSQEELQIAEAVSLYPSTLLVGTKPKFCSLITNLGPATSDDYKGGALPSSGSSGGSRIPTYVKNTTTMLNEKPILQFKVYDINNGKLYDVSTVHGVRTIAYGKISEYADTITHGSTTYKSVGSFLFS